ncbi:MAG: YicC/YloC family endoribonuclease [Candidatus Auribacterota bacterium]
MTLKSMTGYSKVTADTEWGKLMIEVSSLNRKYCEVHVNTPRMLSFLEHDIRKTVSSAISRGRISVNVSLDMGGKNTMVNLQANMVYAEAYIKALREIQQQFNLEGNISIDVFNGNRDIILSDQADIDESVISETINPLLNEGIERFRHQKELEGEKLQADIVSRIQIIIDEVKTIEALAPLSVTAYRDKLLQRLEELQINIPIEEERLAKEVALFADRIDISEELVRLKSHIENFSNTIVKDEPVGKLLDFIIQEMFRETNTIASKSNHIDISHATIRIKNELEKIREQVYNIE